MMERISDTEAMVINDIILRQKMGINKYGTTVAQNQLTPRQWQQHLYEELLDAAIYTKRIIQEMDASSDDYK